MEILNEVLLFLKTTVVTVLGVASGAVAGFVTWWNALPAERVKDFAPFGVIVVGIFGVTIAYRTMWVTRAVARKRAAIDVFIKTAMDEPMIKAYDAFKEACLELSHQPDINVFARTPYYPAIRAYLNIHELIAVGIHSGAFDRKVCHRYWGDILTTGYLDARRVIDYARTQPGGKYTYSDLERLNRNWNTPSWRRWLRFRH